VNRHDKKKKTEGERDNIEESPDPIVWSRRTRGRVLRRRVVRPDPTASRPKGDAIHDEPAPIDFDDRLRFGPVTRAPSVCPPTRFSHAIVPPTPVARSDNRITQANNEHTFHVHVTVDSPLCLAFSVRSEAGKHQSPTRRPLLLVRRPEMFATV